MPILPMRRPAAAPPSQPPTEARARLAQRIAARDQARTRLAALDGWNAAAGRAIRTIDEVTAARDAAAEAVEIARAADAKSMTASLADGVPVPPATVAAARAALVDADDAVVTATVARDAIKAEIAELRAGAERRDDAVTAAAVAVVRIEGGAAIAALLAELDKLHRTMIDRALALRELVRAGAVAVQGADRDARAGALMSRFTMPPATWDLASRPRECPTFAAWQTALDALKADATAPVPN